MEKRKQEVRKETTRGAKEETRTTAHSCPFWTSSVVRAVDDCGLPLLLAGAVRQSYLPARLAASPAMHLPPQVDYLVIDRHAPSLHGAGACAAESMLVAPVLCEGFDIIRH